jgi:hypothetical protein
LEQPSAHFRESGNWRLVERIKPHKVRYYLEQRDPDFAEKMAEVLLALSRRTVDDRNVVRFGVATNAPAKTAGQPHHMRIVQGGVRPGQLLPLPQAEAAGVMSHPEIRVQHDAINAVIAAAQEILEAGPPGALAPPAHRHHGPVK